MVWLVLFLPTELDKLENVLTEGVSMFLENAQKRYATLDIEKAPYFIFFDTKDIVFQTDNESEATSFLKKELSIKQKNGMH
ncbi:hypothetical protein [Ammoniphilus sp. YIM 78166]|uniref:hypothetical protein n=1 Tax=Ammoniphilus sp. YIM 78166 TaxID=1644106 RepID=UPI00142F798D|nr:hypothetical protein [Ammoniphilus sp. YIM 78166]